MDTIDVARAWSWCGPASTTAAGFAASLCDEGLTIPTVLMVAPTVAVLAVLVCLRRPGACGAWWVSRRDYEVLLAF